MSLGLKLAESGRLPDPLLRHGIRRLLRGRLREEGRRFDRDPQGALEEWMGAMRGADIALHTDKANEQHYEVPAGFYKLALGRHLKYSSGLWEPGTTTLDEAEVAMLALTCERADLQDGQAVLELGCGWGSLTLWMAEHYPNSRILAVSNSASQREHILARAAERGLENLEVMTRDVNVFDTPRRFDRVVSVEMFEHVRNWEQLLGRVRGWLSGDDARVFLHVFSHRLYAYPFEADGENDWMARYFFTGGMMPSHGLLPALPVPFEVEEDWEVDGTHYAKTSEAWLRNLDARKDEAMKVLGATYGESEASLWFHRWRLFFLACAELWGYRGGSEWQVSHYRLRPGPEAR
jgi:cyclopropane-fatty-acyl-phospholipid synthase